MTEPTILVKKADGTMIRVPLSEVKKMKEKRPVAEPAAHKAAAHHHLGASAKHATIHHAQSEHKLGVVHHAKPGHAAKAAASLAHHEPKQQESVSLLDEAIPVGTGNMTSHSREDEIKEIISKLTFPVKTENKSRLRAIVQLRLKDVRSEVQTREIALRPEISGGLGLNEKQAIELLSACHTVMMRKNRIEEVPALIMAAPKKEALPATATPNNAFVHGPITAGPRAAFEPSGGGAARLSRDGSLRPEPIDTTHAFTISSAKIRAPMQDVRASAAPIGPVDELAALTLTDFRRLSGSPADAAARVGQKLFNLRDESVLLYVDGLSAWRQSPLYGGYLKALVERLASRAPLKTLSPKETIQPEEIMAIGKLNATL